MYKAFNEYVNNFDIGDEEVMASIEHSLDVAEKMKKYAKKLGYSNEEVRIANEIGLLHEIGKFSCKREEDYTSIGVKVLFEDGLIEKFNIPKEHYEIIKYALSHIEDYKLEKTSDALTMNMTKLLRDADKMSTMRFLNALKEDSGKISPKVLDALKEKKPVPKKDIKTTNDKIAAVLGFSYDMNNDMCIKEFLKYLKDFYGRVGTTDLFKDIYIQAENYLKERIK